MYAIDINDMHLLRFAIYDTLYNVQWQYMQIYNNRVMIYILITTKLLINA